MSKLPIPIALLLIGGCVLFQNCSNASNTKQGGVSDSANGRGLNGPVVATSSQDSSTAGTSGNQGSSSVQALDTADKAFIKKAASGGMLEVQLGNLAETNAKSPDVKAFGEMMVTDHTKANDNLKQIASQLNETPPTDLLPQHAQHKKMLSAQKGAAFDKSYMKMMVEDHNEDIADFKKASQSNNSKIKDFASQTLPVLQKHLDSAKAIMKRM